MRTLSIFLLACVSVVSSCKKNKEDRVPASAQALAGTWAIASLTESVEGQADKDLLVTWDNCLTDNVYVMKEDQTYMQKDLGTFCADTACHYVGVWQLKDNMLSFDKFTGDIEKISNQQLVVTYKYSIMGMNTVRRAVFNKR
jgi:hypothetical protein